MTNEERDLIARYIARVAGSQQGGGFVGGSVPQSAPALPPIDRDADAFIGQQRETNAARGISSHHRPAADANRRRRYRASSRDLTPSDRRRPCQRGLTARQSHRRQRAGAPRQTEHHRQRDQDEQVATHDGPMLRILPRLPPYDHA